jgi:uncharacterized membrane protein YsdA (DUF1294 family)/cold shock CspA family protein
MRKQGKVISWKDDKGFGFIEPSAGGKQVFVHIKAFRDGSRRPTIGKEVSYVESSDAQGRARAENVQSRASVFSIGPASKAFIATSSFLLMVAAIVALGILPRHVLWLYIGMSVLTFAFYAMDKSSAKKGGQRTPESTLHTLALVGGWPGALYAQQLLRHKSSKKSFRSVFWFTLVLNIAGLGYLVSDYGTWLVEMFQNLVH